MANNNGVSRALQSSWRRIAGVALLLQLLFASFVLAEKIVREYEIKAAFVLKFLDFIELRKEEGKSEICVVGVNPFDDSLERLQQAHPNRYKGVVVRNVDASGDVKSCSLGFISRSLSGELPAVLSHFKSLPILTVSDIEGFARSGGMIELVVEGKNIRFVINQEKAKEKGIAISSQLLALAKEIVATDGGES